MILSRSPRKGGNSIEKIYLKDHKIGFCQACYACKKIGKCVQKDDMEAILDKMVKADVVVMATQVYFCTIDAQMKVLIDRTFSRYMEIKRKDFYLIAVQQPGKTNRTYH